MNKIVGYIGIAGFIICLIIMYATNLGERGLRNYDPDFRLLDMRFQYTAADVGETFEKLGRDGRAAYRNFWILDFVFIACFLIVMFAITDKIATNGWARYILIFFSIARAGFHIIETGMLFSLSIRYPVQNSSLVTLSSWITTSKYISLFIWMLGIAVMLLYNVINRKHSN